MKRLWFCIVLLIFLLGCQDNNISDNSNFYIDDNYVYYTNMSGDLLKFSLSEKTKEKLASDFSLKASDSDYLIGYKNNTIKVYNIDTGGIIKIDDVEVNSLCVSNQKIYYSNKNDNNYIYSFDINSMESSKILEESTHKLAVNDKYIFYEKDNDSIYGFNFETNEKIEIFQGRYCFFFCCDEKYVYLSDYMQGNKIIGINPDNKEYTQLSEAASYEFNVFNDKLYYIPVVDETADYKKVKVHIYEYIDNNLSVKIL